MREERPKSGATDCLRPYGRCYSTSQPFRQNQRIHADLLGKLFNGRRFADSLRHRETLDALTLRRNAVFVDLGVLHRGDTVEDTVGLSGRGARKNVAAFEFVDEASSFLVEHEAPAQSQQHAPFLGRRSLRVVLEADDQPAESVVRRLSCRRRILQSMAAMTNRKVCPFYGKKSPALHKLTMDKLTNHKLTVHKHTVHKLTSGKFPRKTKRPLLDKRRGA